MNNENLDTNKLSKTKRKWYHYLLLILLIIILLFGAFLAYLTINEYKPEPIEEALTSEKLKTELVDDDEISILSFNTGYAGLDKAQDFLMDGGSGVGATKVSEVENNIKGIKEILDDQDADIYILQETDLKAKRTFDINQIEAYSETLDDYNWYYAPNFLCKFVPYPLQAPIASIDAGITTFTKFEVNEASRIAMPNPFSWPVRTANLKRCLLLTRMPIEDSDKELVVINFHLEAYDDGEGKKAQTKQLLSILNEEYNKGNYVIAGGDFNQTFPDVNIEVKETSHWVPGKLDAFSEEMNEWRYIYDDTTPTCRLLNQPYMASEELHQTYVIDGFIVSPNIEVRSIQTINEDFEYSDHNPVMMKIKLINE